MTAAKQHTIDDELGLARVGGAKVVGDDALVTALVGKGDVAQVQDRGVLHHASARTRQIRRRTLVVSAHVGVVLHFSVAKELLVLTPGKGHGGGTAAGGGTGEANVATEDCHCGFWLYGDLRLGEVI